MKISTGLIRRAENPDLPLAALQAIRELKEEIGSLERDHIHAARERGAAWKDIAEAMGTTRQALQQRLGRRPQRIGSR